jgi:hypothetical protein
VFSLVPRCQGLLRIGKEDLDREPLGQLLVLGHLFPAIIGQGYPQQGGHEPQFFREAHTGTPCIRPLHRGQDEQACGPFQQGPDGGPIAAFLDEIALPVARLRVTTSEGRSAIGVILGI